jgi:hypothetical protein
LATAEGLSEASRSEPPAGWYPDPRGAGRRYWSGREWTNRYSPPKAKSRQFREVYPVNSRVATACAVAQLSAAGLMLGLLGTMVTWWQRSALFDLASGPGHIEKLGPGYLFGPLMILIALPVVRGRAPHVSFTRLYRVRLVTAALLWFAGAAVLIEAASSFGGEKIQAGAYICAAFIAIGLVATLAMWPIGLRVVKVDRAGKAQEASARRLGS